MKNPLSPNYDHAKDLELVYQAVEGSKEALEELIKRHQHFIYNIAHKMVLSPFDAEDITQEVLIKMVTKLSQFQGKSNFRTWLYRITFNHFLKMKKYWLELQITNFDNYARELDNIHESDISEQEQLEKAELIKEAKLSCMMGMLLCLDRSQRLVYVLGEIFEVDHTLGAELLEISKESFRKRLERARKDLYQFMNHKCGLINKANPCRCARKTNGFIKAGWVDEKKMKFNTAYLKNLASVLDLKNESLDNLLENQYKSLFQQTPFQEKQHVQALMRAILADTTIQQIFNFGLK